MITIHSSIFHVSLANLKAIRSINAHILIFKLIIADFDNFSHFVRIKKEENILENNIAEVTQDSIETLSKKLQKVTKKNMMNP